MIITTSPEYNVIYTARKTQGLHTCNYLKSEWKTIETIPAPTQAPIKTNLFHLTFSSSKNHLKVTQVSSSQPVFPQQSHLKFPWELQLKVLTHTLCQERGSRSVFSRAPASCYHWYNYLQNGKTRIQRQSHSFKVTLFRSGLSDFRTGSAVTSQGLLSLHSSFLGPASFSSNMKQVTLFKMPASIFRPVLRNSITTQVNRKNTHGSELTIKNSQAVRPGKQ